MSDEKRIIPGDKILMRHVDEWGTNKEIVVLRSMPLVDVLDGVVTEDFVFNMTYANPIYDCDYNRHDFNKWYGFDKDAEVWQWET